MENNNIVLSSTTLKTINELLDSKSVSELRKMAPKYGIKSASKYRRPALVSLLADAIEQEYKARLVEEQAKQPKASKPTKKYDYKPRWFPSRSRTVTPICWASTPLVASMTATMLLWFW